MYVPIVVLAQKDCDALIRAEGNLHMEITGDSLQTSESTSPQSSNHCSQTFKPEIITHEEQQLIQSGCHSTGLDRYDHFSSGSSYSLSFELSPLAIQNNDSGDISRAGLQQNKSQLNNILPLDEFSCA